MDEAAGQYEINPLTTDERNRLAKDILAHLSNFSESGIRGKREIMVSAELGKFLSNIVWGDSDDTVAGILVDRLNGHGFLPERPNYHAVGALIAYLLKHPEVSTPDKEFLAGLVVRKGLVRDPSYIEDLRQRFNIADQPPPQLQPQPAPVPPLPDAQIHQPQFEPLILDESGLELARNSESNLLDIIQLLAAAYCAEAVGRVEYSFYTPIATGWLIGPDLLLTNQHVLPDKDTVEVAKVRFGHRHDRLGVAAADGHVFELDPDFYYSSPSDELDYALVRVKERPLADMMIDQDSSNLSFLDLIRLHKHLGYLHYSLRKLRATPKPDRVNIVQHPSGKPQKAALTQNFVTFVSGTRVHYTTDTLNGSSGSPVFTEMWEVVALHHSGKPMPPIPHQPNMNEGIPMTAIIRDMENRTSSDGYPLISYLPGLK